MELYCRQLHDQYSVEWRGELFSDHRRRQRDGRSRLDRGEPCRRFGRRFGECDRADDTAAVFSRCDVRQVGTMSVADVERVIQESLGILPAVDDLNHDGVINIADVQILANAVMGVGCAAQ